jgi:hypothetical protein
MTKEEKCKYFLEEAIKTQHLNQVDSKIIVECVNILCNNYKEREYMVKLRELLINSKEEFNFQDRTLNLFLGLVFSEAVSYSLLKLRDLAMEDYSQSAVDEMVKLLKNDIREEVYEKTLAILKENTKFEDEVGHKVADQIKLYKEIYKSNTMILNALELVSNENEYEMIVKLIRGEKK